VLWIPLILEILQSFLSKSFEHIGEVETNEVRVIQPAVWNLLQRMVEYFNPQTKPNSLYVEASLVQHVIESQKMI
jgi:hypothetical protein